MKKKTKIPAKKSSKGKEVVPVRKLDENIISSIVLRGDIAGLDETQKAKYNIELCKSIGLNPYTQPFQILKLQGKEVLYATKTATEQLRKVYGVSVTSIDRQILNDICVVTANVSDATGRTDAATGAVSISGRKGNDLANDIMKAETKAKRRATLSICGLGFLDESEIETIPGNHQTTTITGEPIKIENQPEIIPMTIEEACKQLREAKDIRELLAKKSQMLKDGSCNHFPQDDKKILNDLYSELAAGFEVKKNV